MADTRGDEGDPRVRAGRGVELDAPPCPEIARRVFSPDVVACLEGYADLLAGDGVVRGVIGPREVPRLWERHLLNCAVIEPLFAQRATVCDVGSGAGLPGIVLAITRPDLQVTLVEPLLRRTIFLEAVVEHLDLTRVEVVRERAEALSGSRVFDAVTSRAVAPLSRLLGWCLPLLAPGGEIHAMKGSRAAEEMSDAAAQFAGARCGRPRLSRWGAGVVSPQATVVSVARSHLPY